MKKLIFTLFALGLLTACTSTSPTVRITLDSAAMKFQPTTIEVQAGQPVELTFNNQDLVDHDFTIMDIPVTEMEAHADAVAGHEAGHVAGEPELHMAVQMGKSGTLDFTPTETGSYEFYCTVAGHKEAGMVGTLIVK